MLNYSEYPTNTTTQRTVMSLNEPQRSELKRRWPSVASPRKQDHTVSEPCSLLSPFEVGKFHPFLHLASHPHVSLIQIKSELSITHQHTVNCSSVCPYHCCSPHIGGKALVIWIATSSGASASHFGSQDRGVLQDRGFLLSTTSP